MTAMAPVGPAERDDTPLPEASDDAAERGGSLAGWYLILVLTLAYTVSFIDRQVLNLLVGPIKAEFGLNDTQLSLLQGVAFTSAYVIMSPLFGRIADVGSRKGVLMFGIVLWSIGTSCCGLARSYWQLFLARFGVGGAEACLTPAAWSIIADAFPPRMIPRAFSVYMMGPYLGGGLALIFGGLLLRGAESWDLSAIPLLGAMKPWQLVFFLAGVPGLAIAVMMLFVKEPVRRSAAGASSGQAPKMTGEEIRATFRRWRGFYGNFYTGMPLFIVTLYAFPAWMPTVLIRKFGVPAAQVGVEYGIAVLVTGSLGVLVSPWVARLAERLGRRDSLMLVPLIACAAMVPLSLALMAATTYRSAFVIATAASLVYSLPQALSSSALQLVTPNRMRGIASSIYVFVVSIAGLALAPTAVALITNHVFNDEGRVGDSLAITCAVAAAAGAVFLFRALPAYRRMLDAET
ncbi:MFS transporter [Novosphingobium gossypii]|uniref:MFS transporter n=1 Tax=Novosphingobium gossypii TaxID=1604774 RepID=UPI003D1A5785